jgi:hypothetical protein
MKSTREGSQLYADYDKWKKLMADASKRGHVQDFKNAKYWLGQVQSKIKGFEALMSKMNLHSQLLGEQREKMLGGFRTQSEAGIARQLEAQKRGAALSAARRGFAPGSAGIGGGRAAAIAETQLRGAGEASFQDFQTKLGMLQSQQQDAMLRGEFGFINEMAKIDAMQAFEEKMTLMREKLQRDRESRNAFWGLAGSIGGWLAGGPVGGMVGGWFGGSAGGGGLRE